MTVLTPVVWLTTARKMPTSSSLRSQGVAMTWLKPLRWVSSSFSCWRASTISMISSSMEPSFSGTRTRLRAPMAS